MAKIDFDGLYRPYAGYVQQDSEAGHAEARDLIVAREMISMCPVDSELADNFMLVFGRWLRGWEARLNG